MDTALVIDGTETQRKLFSTLLQRRGFSLESLTAEEAYTAPSLAVDIVIYIWGKGDLDEVAVRRLRNNYPTTALIAVSAHAFPQERARAMKAGFDDFLVMPFSVEDFDSVLNIWTHQRLDAKA
ncbi:MAG: response regulator [Cyanobacteria bacterium SZAS-4]|nr:response regulator [Cyanobacteria bacterium SZAS-4]